MDASDVTIAVLNYNGRRFLEVALPSIVAQSVTGFAVHVMDNASTDGSQEWLAEHWPQVRLFASPENLDVTHNMARAIACAETPYVALLNNDLELDERWLEEMMAELDRHPEAAAVDCKMLSYHERGTLDGTGDALSRAGSAWRRGHGEPDDGRHDTPGEVFSVSGGAALYRRSAFDLVGPYDVDLGAYYEDVDWGFRARLKGLTARYAPRAIAFHMGSATTSGDPARYTPLLVRNQVLVTLKNFPAPLLLRYAPRIAVFEVQWFADAVREGRARHHLRGLLGALRMLPATLRKRRAVQRGRVVAPSEIARLLH